MRTIDEVEALRQQLIAEGQAKPDVIRQLALDCLEWPYVFGAWGEQCSPAGRKRYLSLNPSHTTIKTKCPNLNSGKACSTCKWGIGVRMYDCRGFTRWLLRQVDLDITGSGCTSQYNKDDNWVKKGPISEMPDVVCCVFKYKASTGKYEHTGMHIGGGMIVHCSSNVQTGKTSQSGWTHYAIPKGLYDEEDIPVETLRPTLRKGSSGEHVAYLQERLNALGYDCGSIDGIFGKKTLAAVKAFQKDHSLEQDGVVGRITWAWLEGLDHSPADAGAPQKAGEPEQKDQKYTVKCYGMTWEQVMEIRQTCPTATVEKE